MGRSAEIPKTFLIEEKNFHNAWARAVLTTIRGGTNLTIGDTDEPKSIRDACTTIVMTGNAIRQIEARELHPQFPFRHIDPYCDEFTREYLSQYIEKPSQEHFSYLYFKRLAMYGDIDQLEDMRQDIAIQIHTEIASNRDQMVTWIVECDSGSSSPPCLQRVWIRYLGNKSVEVHLTWRSRDLYTAWQANIIALVDMLNREVIRPNNCRIVKLVDYNDSLHIYKSDIAVAGDVRLIPTSPQDR